MPSAASSAATDAAELVVLGPVGPRETAAVRDHAARQHAPTALHEARHGQRVEHLVRDHGAVERLLGETIEPRDTVAEARERAALTLAQVGARLEDPIRDARVAERVEDLRRERAATRAELENERRPAARELGSQRARERAAEKVRELGRRREVAGRPELRAAGAVVAEARRIERELHVTREIEPAARARDSHRESRATAHC